MQPEQTTLRDENFKKQDAELYSQLPTSYARIVDRLCHFIVVEICEQAGLKPGYSVLDVGSGAGTATLEAARRIQVGGRVIGIDIAPGLVEIANRDAREQGLPVDCYVMDAENLHLPDETFDVVISFSAIFHFPDPGRAIAEMFRVLKPNGRFVLTYTAVRPERSSQLMLYFLRQAKLRLMAPLYPFLTAPGSLESSAANCLPPLRHVLQPDWGTNNAGQRILSEMAIAGFDRPEQSWVGRNVEFDSAEEFYDAQLMISSNLRTRAAEASERQKEVLRKEYLELARSILRRRGKLLYPFGAVLIKATKPPRSGSQL
jgi:ubiquinone/menaquinone biosynthesis C-methylase UbiE